MEKLVCELCGGNKFVKQGDFFVCEHCETKYSIEDAKKLMGKVEIDNTKETENLYTLARRAKKEGNVEKAKTYYSKLVKDNPNDWEAYFFDIYYTAMDCKIGEISSAVSSIMSSLSTINDIIEPLSEDEKKTAINEISTYTLSGLEVLDKSAYHHYNEFSSVAGSEATYNKIESLVSKCYLELLALCVSANDKISTNLVASKAITFSYRFTNDFMYVNSILTLTDKVSSEFRETYEKDREETALRKIKSDEKKAEEAKKLRKTKLTILLIVGIVLSITIFIGIKIERVRPLKLEINNNIDFEIGELEYQMKKEGVNFTIDNLDYKINSYVYEEYNTYDDIHLSIYIKSSDDCSDELLKETSAKDLARELLDDHYGQALAGAKLYFNGELIDEYSKVVD